MRIFMQSLLSVLALVSFSTWGQQPPNIGNLNARVVQLEGRVAQLTSTVNNLLQALQNETAARQAADTTLQSALNNQNLAIQTLQANTVLDLNGYLTFAIDNSGYATARFTGVNVQVVNGEGSTETLNGTGNLIVGYHELPLGSGARGPGIFRTGSHNLIAGSRNNYEAYGGLVAGRDNSISGPYATISGGQESWASAEASSISGGGYNIASGYISSVSGGINNTASGYRTSVSGGAFNTATGDSSTIGGGAGCTATAHNDWVAGTEGGGCGVLNN